MGIYLDWARSASRALHGALTGARERRTALTALIGIVSLLVAAAPVPPDAPAGLVPAPAPAADERVLRTERLTDGTLVTRAEVGTLALSDCPVGSTCIWTSPLYGGTLFQFNHPGTVLTLPAVPIGSYANRRSKRTTFYETTGGGGRAYCAAPWTQNQAVAGWLTGARSIIQSSTSPSC
jgi:hypothetical protein